MNYPLSQLRNIVSLASFLEQKAIDREKYQGPEYVVLGVLSYEDQHGEIKEMEVRDSLNPDKWTPYVAKMVTGEVAIYAPLFRMPANAIIGALAHEIGHLLSGHFGKKRVPMIDRNVRKQELYYRRYTEDPSEKNADLYQRALYIGMLKGGVNDVELEADMTALNYVTPDSLILMHSLLLSHDNPVPTQEKINRVKRLASIHPVPQAKRHFELTLNNPHQSRT